MTDMTGVAKETFQVLLRYDYVVKLYDADGMAIAEPTEARRMFASKPNLMVSLNDSDDDSSIKLLFGKSTHANDIDGLMQALRTTATKYNLTFEPRQYGKEIDAKDYQNMMSVAESKKEFEMQLCEGMYGTSRSSYLVLENAKMIVHHDARINPTRAEARAHHINSIFLENAAGERVRFPSTELRSARKMAEHLNEGGQFNDAAGLAIQHTRPFRGKKPRQMTARSLAENNPVVRDFMLWTEQFAPDRALLESDIPDAPIVECPAPMGEAKRRSEEFTREDILLPHKNQADGLARDVSKATVHDDPADPDETHAPGAPYLSRLKTLAGMHSHA